ncbi:MAG: cell division protein FtsQ/DivIB [Gammaproteobacteria bacterium]|nr:cell division protein FtsQ/DivIB [Gammaproteobacteria bacterium]
MAALTRRFRDQFFLSMLIACALLLVARLSYIYVANPETYPINTFKIVANYQHITRQQIEQILEKYAHAGFFSISVRQLRTDLLALDWAKAVRVERIWPDTLKVRVEEKQPVAIWNHVLLTEDGLLFDLSSSEWQKESAGSSLPELTGPKDQQLDVLQMYRKLSKLSDGYGLHASSLALLDNQAWELGLANGVVLRLGKRDLELRLTRFCRAYPVVFAEKLEQLVAVDLRYIRGMAAQWKDATK